MSDMSNVHEMIADCSRMVDELPSVAEHNAVKLALSLAVARLALFEPPDSRAVSNEFVALAAVSVGDMSEPVMTIIRDALQEASEQ